MFSTEIDTQRHSDDATSVNIWVEEMKERGQDNPVLSYKPQGTLMKGCHNLTKDDFFLVLQTPLQADMLKQFSKIICIDGTHGTNGYDFTLVTLLVVDEFGEGFPAAWCLCNKEDTTQLTYFYTILKERVGTLSPTWFMSDDADQYFTAWTKVFNDKPHKLLCSWHVDRAWRVNLMKIRDRDIEATVYHNLRVLLEERDRSKFEKLLEATTEQLSHNESTKSFSEYFQNNYVGRKEQWAACYRQGSMINTNMYVEAFHRVLKYLYLKGKINKRVDKCIYALLKLCRDKAFERFAKLEKGKISKRITTIVKRHQTSLELSKNNVTVIKSGEEWSVHSQRTYTVKLQHTQCPFNCHVRCTACNICVHQYSCECMDELLHSTICKHIHLVARKDEPTAIHQDSEYISTTEGSQALINSFQLQCQRQPELSLLKEKLIKKLSIITGKISTCNDHHTLVNIERFLTSAIGTFDALDSQDKCQFNKGMPKTTSPANKNIERQPSFYNTTKRKRKATIRLAKPNVNEKDTICKTLLNPYTSLYRRLTQQCIGKLSTLKYKSIKHTRSIHQGY